MARRDGSRSAAMTWRASLANWTVFPPTPAKASSTTPPAHRPAYQKPGHQWLNKVLTIDSTLYSDSTSDVSDLDEFGLIGPLLGPTWYWLRASGVTEYHPSGSSSTPSSNLEKKRYR
eukprot:84310-Prorocentrum_minimum.AAC.1